MGVHLPLKYKVIENGHELTYIFNVFLLSASSQWKAVKSGWWKFVNKIKGYTVPGVLSATCAWKRNTAPHHLKLGILKLILYYSLQSCNWVKTRTCFVIIIRPIFFLFPFYFFLFFLLLLWRIFNILTVRFILLLIHITANILFWIKYGIKSIKVVYTVTRKSEFLYNLSPRWLGIHFFSLISSAECDKRQTEMWYFAASKFQFK